MEANLGVLAFKIRVLLQKLVIICATRAGANFRVLSFKISVLRPYDLDIVSVWDQRCTSKISYRMSVEIRQKKVANRRVKLQSLWESFVCVEKVMSQVDTINAILSTKTLKKSMSFT